MERSISYKSSGFDIKLTSRYQLCPAKPSFSFEKIKTTTEEMPEKKVKDIQDWPEKSKVSIMIVYISLITCKVGLYTLHVICTITTLSKSAYTH